MVSNEYFKPMSYKILQKTKQQQNLYNLFVVPNRCPTPFYRIGQTHSSLS